MAEPGFRMFVRGLPEVMIEADFLATGAHGHDAARRLDLADVIARKVRLLPRATTAEARAYN
ncbi:MAG: hypothetical protein WCK47_03995 [bacterium]|nr:hypothetical protein [Candidatus Sumerlaeota bacterium]